MLLPNIINCIQSSFKQMAESTSSTATEISACISTYQYHGWVFQLEIVGFLHNTPYQQLSWWSPESTARLEFQSTTYLLTCLTCTKYRQSIMQDLSTSNLESWFAILIKVLHDSNCPLGFYGLRIRRKRGDSLAWGITTHWKAQKSDIELRRTMKNLFPTPRFVV